MKMKELWKPVNSPLGPVPRINPWLWENKFKWDPARGRDAAWQDLIKNALYGTTALTRALENTNEPKT